MKKNGKDMKKTMNTEIPKSYGVEDEMDMYKLWEESGYFSPEAVESMSTSSKSKKSKSKKKKPKKSKSKKKPFVMTLPPPNANGRQHVGHMCGYSFQDCMGRYHRMKGEPTLLLAGKDHAGIQTEAVFTRVLKKQGVDKWKLGREEFYKRCYDFCIKNADYAREQEKRIGLSADWSREKFTLDPRLTKVVYETFFEMLKEGLIYRGEYIINQCTYCRTALANIDTEHEQKKGIFAYIRYTVVGEKDKYVTVATTRPETMLGDTAVAVNPKDDRYKKLIGKKVQLPLTDREIPVIAERKVDMKLGTGALKITPAHSAVDFDIGREHDLKTLNVIDETGKMNTKVPEKYQGMTTLECRKEVLKDLEAQGLLEKVEDITHDVVVCERCKSNIEQIISKQWFVDVKDLAGKAAKAVDNGDTKMVPDYFGRVMTNWLRNIRPWCISRQLWWGHRIPVWYCGGKELYDWLSENPGKNADDYTEATGKKAHGCGKILPVDKKPEKCPTCGSCDLEPEEDCFDTWFSSGQWTFSTLGGLRGDDFMKFYPTDVMETMHDIIFFWVARMMMIGIYKTGKVPFHTVYYHGMILAPDGRKMSKSKDNIVDPTDVFEKFGADALRLWFFSDALPGKNTPIRDEKLKGNRNFVNKIWNASRYIMMQAQDLEQNSKLELGRMVFERIQKLSKSEDNWEKSTYETAQKIDGHLMKYRFNLAVEHSREFFWHTFCDKWIEETKQLIADTPEKKVEYLARLVAILAVQMKLIHPFAPFVTEKVWQSLRNMGLLGNETELLMVSKWPVEPPG